jgi:hypothetical protein
MLTVKMVKHPRRIPDDAPKDVEKYVEATPRESPVTIP